MQQRDELLLVDVPQIGVELGVGAAGAVLGEESQGLVEGAGQDVVGLGRVRSGRVVIGLGRAARGRAGMLRAGPLVPG